MNLKEFIKESIVQISQGITEAEDELQDSSAVVNPRHVATAKTDGVYGYMVSPDDTKHKYYRAAVQSVDFDVAVYASESTGKKAGVGLMVGTVGIGAQGKEESGSRSESRIKFSVPVTFPFSKKTA